MQKQSAALLLAIVLLGSAILFVTPGAFAGSCPCPEMESAVEELEVRVEALEAQARRVGRAATGGQPPSAKASQRPADQPGSLATVWVNTASGVYHCPGSRWYGATKQGTYMTEQQAQSQGSRPAYGNPCH